MCLLLLALEQHPEYRFILAANRDEYYDRPTMPAGFWEDRPDLLAGRDLRSGGTWLGILKTGRLAAVTNYRDPMNTRSSAPSRGMLVRDYLEGSMPAETYLDELSRIAHSYNAFNLVAGSVDGLFWYSNRGRAIRPISKGVHGLSNHVLDTPWPKVKKGKERLNEILVSKDPLNPEVLFSLLRDQTQPPDRDLPETGVGPEWERILAPLFISSPVYGTRSSTIILVDRQNQVLFTERTFNSHPDHFKEASYRFRLVP